VQGPVYVLSWIFGSVQLISPQVFTPLVVPAAPSNLTARAVSDTEIDLTWSSHSWNETAFEIWMQGAAGWIRLGTVPAGHTAEPITGLAPGTTFSFMVRALNATGASAFSNVATATTSRTFADVTIASATPNSPLRAAGAQTLFHALNAGAFFDMPPADGVVSGFAAGGLFPRWPQPTNGSPPVTIVREGNQFATVNGQTANLALVTEFPGSAGSNGGSQYLAVHLRVGTDAQGNITGVNPIFATGGDNSAGFAGRIMTAFQIQVFIDGNINGRVTGSVDVSLYLDEFHATAGGLVLDHHVSVLHLAYDLPVSQR
jgi:hypothetical protein